MHRNLSSTNIMLWVKMAIRFSTIYWHSETSSNRVFKRIRFDWINFLFLFFFFTLTCRWTFYCVHNLFCVCIRLYIMRHAKVYLKVFRCLPHTSIIVFMHEYLISTNLNGVILSPNNFFFLKQTVQWVNNMIQLFRSKISNLQFAQNWYSIFKLILFLFLVSFRNLSKRFFSIIFRWFLFLNTNCLGVSKLRRVDYHSMFFLIIQGEINSKLKERSTRKPNKKILLHDLNSIVE